MVLDEPLCSDSEMAVLARPGNDPGPCSCSTPCRSRSIRSHAPSEYFTTAASANPPFLALTVGFGFFPFRVTGW
jgi:hypothetical protein